MMTIEKLKEIIGKRPIVDVCFNRVENGIEILDFEYGDQLAFIKTSKNLRLHDNFTIGNISELGDLKNIVDSDNDLIFLIREDICHNGEIVILNVPYIESQYLEIFSYVTVKNNTSEEISLKITFTISNLSIIESDIFNVLGENIGKLLQNNCIRTLYLKRLKKIKKATEKNIEYLTKQLEDEKQKLNVYQHPPGSYEFTDSDKLFLELDDEEE